MRREDSLHQIIQSLDSHEKRQFKIYVSSQQKNNYLKLFDIMDKMKVYDESKVKQKLGNTNTAKNLRQSKKYLKDIILRSMRSATDIRPEDRVAALLKEQDFLNKKNLFKEQWKRLQKAKNISIEFELFEKHLEILDLEMLYLNEKDFNLAVDTYEVYKETKESLLYKLDIYNRLIISKNYIFHFLARYRNKIDETNIALVAAEINKFDNSEIARIDSFTIKMWNYNNRSNYHALVGNTQKQFDYQQKLVNLFDEYPQFKQSNTRRYLILLFNYIGAIFKLEDFALLKEKLDDIAAIKIVSENDRGEFYQNYTLYRLLYAMNTGNLEEAMTQSEDATINLDKYKKKINASSLLTLYYNYALIFFFAEDFDNAILWLEKVKIIKSDVRKDLQSFASLLSIICHYELGNHFLIESLCRSINRGHSLSTVEKMISSSLRKLAVSTVVQQQEIWENLKTFLENTKGRIVGRVMLFFWIDSHLLENQSINQLYRISVKS